MDYVAPGFRKDAFNCPLCEAYAHMKWKCLLKDCNTYSFIYTAECARCHRKSYWLNEEKSIFADIKRNQKLPQEIVAGKMIFPALSNAPLPHQSIPENCRKDFIEAREIFNISPRASAALLRLSLQKLCQHLGYSGKNINEDVTAMVHNGLPVEVQQMMDYVRVTGNNAVHPGELDINDTPELTLAMFEFINEIVDTMIAKPEKIKAMYEKLPESIRKNIDNRDKKATEKNNY